MLKRSVELEDILTEYDPDPYFALLDLFFSRNKEVLVKHHIDSFNQLIEEIIPNILQNSDNIISEKTTENKVIRYRLTFDDLSIIPPAMDNDEELMYPLDAVQKNLSYSSKYTATVTQWQDVIDINTDMTETKIIGNSERDVPIAKVPIMVGSKYCNLTLRPDLSRKHCKYDSGGYFIINGSEKVVLSVESIIHRKPLVFTQKDQNTIIYNVRVQSRPVTQFVGNMQVFTIKIKKDNSILLSIPFFKEISIFVLMRALGLETDEDIVDSILDVKREKALLNQLSISMNVQGVVTVTQSEAIEILINNLGSTKTYFDTNPEIRLQQKKKYVMKILTQFILPHVSSGTNNTDIDMIYKAHYIGYMIHKLLKCYLKDNKEVEEYRGCDDRDSLVNKRIELTGILLGTLFEQFFKKMLNDCNKIFKSKNINDKKPPNIINHIKPNPIEQGLRQALSTGAFGTQTRKGLSQMLNRMNHLHSLSYMRRIITPTIDASTNKMTSPRHLHNTQYGSICPLETPEGPKTGIVKNLAMLASITVSVNSQIPIVEKYLEGKIITIDSANKKKIHNYVKVFINGNWLGVTKEVIKIHTDLRNMRFRGELEKTVSISINYREKELHVFTEGGRLFRPYLTVRDNKLLFKPEMLDGIKSWDEFMTKYPDVIEFLDKEEEQNMMLAAFPAYIEKSHQIMTKKPLKSQEEIDIINRTNRYDGNVYPRYTHCEIHPCMILGLISSNIPFSDHNQSPRGIFQYNQARQAMGLYISDYRERIDISYILYHTQIPIVTSRASKYTGTNVFPAGENVIVAIASYMGFNQEDSLLMNNSAIEKGLFRAQALKKYFETVKKNLASSQTGVFMKPDRNKVDGLKDVNYGKLSEEGYAKTETYIKDGDVIIGMVNPKPTSKEDEKPYKDNSTIYRSYVPGAIDKVLTGLNNDGYPIIKIRVRSERIPAVGDKFSCYDKETQVLTNEGWIFFDHLTKEHQVATLVNGEELVYEYPSEIQKYHYQGKMYQIKSKQVDLCVTPNHNMWVATDNQYHLEKTDETNGKKRFYQKNVSKYQNKDQSIFFLNCWLSIFGLWVNEGYIFDDIVTIFTYTQLAKNEIISACKEMGIQFYHYHDLEEKDVWQIMDKCLVHGIKNYSTDSNEILPKWVWGLSSEQTRHLICSIMCDGDWSDNGNIKYNILSDRLAGDLQRLCLHAGWSADINSEYLTVRTQKNHPQVNKNKINDEWINYDDQVYCCTVTSGVIYVRRNGIPVFSGNSRAAQKGTIGFKPHRADLPFTINGIIPDIIINPNCMPKRMTIGQLIECLLGKVCAIKGVYGDATPFTGVNIQKINQELVKAGYQEWGNETMYNGMTGQEMETDIFIGPTYYQRLKQMVGDKVHSRARGPVQLLTRQPPEGRSRDGGLRAGEMERDAMCAHGIAQFLKERLVDNSDIYTCYVCDICGLFAHKVPDKKYYTCTGCKNTTKVSKIVIPYAFKLFMQELRSINILGRIRTTKSIITPRD